MTHMQVGDEIEVQGQRFVLVHFEENLNKPSRVTFVQPAELLEEALEKSKESVIG